MNSAEISYSLTKIAEGFALLAASLSDTTDPVQQEPAPTPVAVPEPAPAPVVELDQVRAKLAELSRAGHTEQVRQLINATGADKLSDVDPARYHELLTAAEQVTA